MNTPHRRQRLLSSLVTLVLAASGCSSDGGGSGAGSSGGAGGGGSDGSGSGFDVLTALGPIGVDLQSVACDEPAYELPACVSPTLVPGPDAWVATHVPLPTAIDYDDEPPSSGPHRPEWARWGEYDYLPPQRWLHNCEHGGLALLYHPCAPASVRDDLYAWATAQPRDEDGGEFRWVLTPYPGLQTPAMVVAWNVKVPLTCVEDATLDAFKAEHYRNAYEDVAAHGGYDYGWLGD